MKRNLLNENDLDNQYKKYLHPKKINKEYFRQSGETFKMYHTRLAWMQKYDFPKKPDMIKDPELFSTKPKNFTQVFL